MLARRRQAFAPPDFVRLGLPFVAAYGDGGLGLLGDPTRRAIFELLARRPSLGAGARRPAADQPTRGVAAPAGAEGRRAGRQPTPRAPAGSTGSTPRASPRCAPGSTASGATRWPVFTRPPTQRPPDPDSPRTGEPMTTTAPIPPDHRHGHRRRAHRAGLRGVHRLVRHLVAARVPHRRRPTSPR